MENVYTSSIGVPKTARNKRIYGNGDSFVSSTVVSRLGTQSAVTPKDVFDFTDDATPTISDYQTNYTAIHGEYPLVRLVIVIDSLTEYESAQRPYFTKVDGLIDTIYFDLGSPFTGYIILQ